MKLSDYLKSVGLLTLFVVAFVSSFAFGQTTYYVNNQIGLDGYDGLHATITGVPGEGPKLTISNAITAASAGDIISVAAFAPYDETLTIDKKLTFLATGGQVDVIGTPGLVLNNTDVSPNDLVTFSGSYKFGNGVQLIDGRIAGGNNLTVGTSLQFTVGNGVSVDAQINFIGTVNFTYLGSGNHTTGYELPAAANTTNFNTLTTALGVNLTLNEGKNILSTLSTGGTLDLGGYTLNLSGAGSTHTLGGDVTNGTVNFSSTSVGTVTVNGSFDLPNIMVTGGNANGKSVTINTNGAVGNVSVTGSYIQLLLQNATSVGNISNASTGSATFGQVIVVSATTVGDLTNTSTGGIQIAAATSIGSITNSGRRTLGSAGTASAGTGVILIASANVTVDGNVELNSVVTSANQAPGEIHFTSSPVTINGNVYNNMSQTLAINVTATYTAQNYGVIDFAGTVTVNGEVKNSASFSGSITVGTNNFAAAFENNGDIRFLGALNNVTITGAITNNATATSLAITGNTASRTVSYQSNGRITFAANGAAASVKAVVNNTSFPNISGTGIIYGSNGTILFGNNPNSLTVASVTNTSASGTASNGTIDFGQGAGTVTVTGAVLSSGAAGGSIIFPASNLSFTTVTNQRTAAGGNIVFGNAAATGVTVNASDIVNSGAADIIFNSTQDGNVVLSGKLENTGSGSITFPNLTSAQVTAGAFNLTAGKVDFSGSAATGGVVVKNITLTGGTIDFGTGTRTFTISGPSNQFSNVTVSNSANTTFQLVAPTPTTQQSLTIGAAGVVWPGKFDVNNGTGLAEAVFISGGNLRVLSDVSFTQGFVVINGVNQKLFIGREVAPASTGNFTNNGGYRTDNNAFVSVNGSGTATISGTGVFGNFEVDATNGAAVAGTFKSTFNLTKGIVTGGTAIVFDNATSYPTIVRNAGTFAVAPTFTSMVNVYYIGVDKSTANELPTASNKLNDLTVATTNGAVSGKGVVNVAVPTTVNGTLTINANQALLLDGVDLTLNGSSVVLNGDIANVNSTDRLVFNKATGTTVTGSGWLPDILINAGSLNNSINGPHGLLTGLLGTNKVRGVDDYDPSTSPANGSITFSNGTGGLSVAFGTGAANNTNVYDITTLNAGNTLTIAANMGQAGNISHSAGTISVADGAVWTYRGLTPVMTGGAAAITGNGTLTFFQPTSAGNNVTLNVNTAAGTIAVKNFEINLGASGDLFTVAVNALTLSGNVTVTRGELVLNQNVTVTGSALTLTGNSSVSGGSILRLNPTVPPLTFSYTGSSLITQLTISNDVVLAGTGSDMTVTGAFLHDGGNLNFADRNLTISGTYTRTAGTYSATSGYLIIAGGSFSKGTTNFSIPNLMIQSAGSFAAAGTGVVTVTSAFDLDNGGTFTQQVGGNNTLTIGDGVDVTLVRGTLDAAPTYAGKINLYLKNTSSVTVPAVLWTATVPVVNLTVQCAPNTATLPGNRTVQSNVNLIAGTLATGSNALTTNDNANILVQNGYFSGTLTAGADNNVTYQSSGSYSTGPELPATVKNLTISRFGNVSNAAVTVNKAVTVTGLLNISNDITMGTNGKVSVSGDVTVVDGSGSNATPTVLTFNSNPLTFTGSNQMFALGGDRKIDKMALNQVGTNAKVVVSGGDLEISSNIALTNGLLVMASNDNMVYLSSTSTQGFTKPANSTNLSHIVGNVMKSLATGTTGRFEFPVGTMKDYRSVAFTFLSSNPVISTTDLVVMADSTNPGGVNGFPITYQGVTVDTTAGFAWKISSSVSLGPSQTFDLELQGSGFTNYTNVADIRVISRLGNVITNPWSVQGGTYINFESVPGTPIVRLTGSTGNLVNQGATFTYGFKGTGSALGHKVSGQVLYANSNNTPVKDVVVTLNPGGLTSTTDASGNFSFSNVANGTYTLTAATSKAWPSAGVNATDALLVSQAYAGSASLSAIQFKAADVNLSNSVNNTDALLIVRRYAGLISSFDAGNWVFSSATVNVSDADVAQNLSTLAAGDVNGSINSGLNKQPVGATLDNDGTINIDPKAESFVLPVKIGEDVKLGAISLRFTYPKDQATFEGISSVANGLVSNDDNGVISIAWVDLTGGKEPLNLKSNSDLFTIKFKTTPNFKEKSNFALKLEAENSELANSDGEVIPNALLKSSSVSAVVPTEFALEQNYPNPFNPSTVIQYSLKEKAQVNLVVYNVLGQIVSTLVDQVQEASTYKVNFNGANLSSGAYFYKITVKSESGAEFTQVNRMMLLK